MIEILQTEMERPTPYGWFHLMWIILSFIAIFVLYKLRNRYNEKQLKIVLSIYGIIVFILELLKQISWAYNVDTHTWSYSWYSAPFQLCTMPIYISLICIFLKKSKLRDYLLSFLCFYTILGSIATMIMPDSCFVSEILINIHTMYLHCGSFVISIYLLMNEIKPTKDNFIGASIVFIICVLIALLLDISFYKFGFIWDETFNMFFISPYFPSTLPVFNIIYDKVPYLVFLLIYILLLSLGAFIVYFIDKFIGRIIMKLKDNKEKVLKGILILIIIILLVVICLIVNSIVDKKPVENKKDKKVVEEKKEEGSTKEEEKEEEEVIVKEVSLIKYMSSRMIYEKEVEDKLNEYLDENAIEIIDDLEIDVNDVVESDTCSGKLVFKVKDGIILLDTEVSCINEEEEDTYEPEFTIFSLEDTTESILSIVKDENNYLVTIREEDNNTYEGLKIIKLDKDYNVIFNKELKTSEYKQKLEYNYTKPLIPYILDYKKIDDNYYFIVTFGNTNGWTANVLYVVDSNGNELVNQKMKVHPTNIYSANDNELYVKRDGSVLTTYNIKEDKVVSDIELPNSIEGIVHPLSMDFENKILYVYTRPNNYVSNNKEHYDGEYKIYKLDYSDSTDIKILKEVDILDQFGKDGNYINNLHSRDDYRHILYKDHIIVETKGMFNEEGKIEKALIIYDNDLNLVKKISYVNEEMRNYKMETLNINVADSFDYCLIDNDSIYKMFVYGYDYILVDRYDLNGEFINRNVYKYDFPDKGSKTFTDGIIESNDGYLNFYFQQIKPYNFIQITKIKLQ